MISTGKAFIHENFMLQNKTAETLYHTYAKTLPIIDYHCHVPPQEIAENRQFNNISEIWLHGDHYKWRAMRAVGVEETFITGDGDDKEKFLKWAETVPYTMGNPLYHWTHLELKRYFGIDELLSSETAEAIWSATKEQLAAPERSVQGIIKESNVKVICTTDDPSDHLEAHQQIRKEGACQAAVYPAFRPDKALVASAPSFVPYLETLGAAAEVDISSLRSLLEALEKRATFFAEEGCVLSDHGLRTLPFVDTTEKEAEAAFQKALNQETLTPQEEEKYQTYVLLFLARLYNKLSWTMQFHLGALRNNNSRMVEQVGPDSGFDSMADDRFAESLNRFLNELERTNELPKTILYTLNPIYNEVIATTIGNFQGGGIPGKIQFGSGWWFNDTKDGMEKQMTDLANNGLLSLFVGMLTDSRSFLSYTRHEYFRRILCNRIGEWVERGEWPADEKWLGKVVEDISYYNAKRYFAFPK
ncbi:glucuronate isomerase [Shouchella clausii]|uniref:glucuronate isomerase n=1 Tax=Shouchella clausii TaxID=79880 RepID=UPI000BA5FA04|nr:glucuronate isomerase [Shouchella clausii]MCZ1183347.1 glucuronate isomerase [Shouchella clausii]PAD46474.1 glucuronate isomerase [Shouchella clausii]PAF08511.1 glucuronate isomerase [Shouchella clausii]